MSLRGFLEGAVDVAGGVIKVAGPAAAGFAAGGPVGAALAVSGQVAGGLEKRRGKEAERVHRRPPVHKATAPAAAVAAPTLLAALLAALGLEGGDQVAGVLCGQDGAALGVLAGLGALLSHQVGHGLQTAPRSRR